MNQTYEILKKINLEHSSEKQRQTTINKESFNHKTQSMKQMWRELGSLLNTSKKKSNTSINSIIVDHKILNNDKDIANALNKNFT